MSPIGWNSGRFGHCYQSVIPTKDSGMQLSLRRNLSSYFRRSSDRKQQRQEDVESQEEVNQRYDKTKRILERQRSRPRTFTGSAILGDEDNGVSTRVTDRLATPAEGRARPRTGVDKSDVVTIDKPVYTKAELNNMMDKIEGQSGERNEDQRKTSRLKKAEILNRFNRKSLYYPAAEIAYALDEFCEALNRGSSEENTRPTASNGRIKTGTNNTTPSKGRNDDTRAPTADNNNRRSSRSRQSSAMSDRERLARRIAAEDKLNQIIDRVSYTRHENKRHSSENRSKKRGQKRA